MSYFRRADLFPSAPSAPQHNPSASQPRIPEPISGKSRALDSPKQNPLNPTVPASTRKPLLFEPTNLTSTSIMGLRAATLKDPTKSVAPAFIYENQVKVRIKAPDREEWQTMLSIKIEMKTIGGHNEQMLNFELTDENDPFFLFTMECGESDFITLKNEQNLIFDFQLFPNKFIELLELCPVVKKTNALTEDPAERFSCVLFMGYSETATFNIVEINHFKQLTHLSLRFKSGDDESTKKYLAARLQEFKAENTELKTKLENTEDSLNLQMNANEKLKADLRTEREENAKLADAIRLDAQRQFNDLKEQMLAEIERCNAKHNAEKSKLKDALEAQVMELNEKLNQALETNSDLSAKILNLEASERELLAKTQKQEHEIQLQMNELTLLRGTNKNLDTTKFSQEKSLVELRVRCETMQKQLEDKEQLVKNTTGLYEASKEQCSQLEETIAILKSNAGKMEEKLIMSAQEINKGNEIIKQLQGDLKAAKQKNKLKEGVCTQQEQLIEQNKRTMEEMTRALNDSKREVTNKEEEIKLLKSKIEELKTKLAESQKMLESNEQMILWLNKAINEREQRAIPSTSSHIGTSFGARDPMSSIKSTPNQYYSTYQSKYATKPYVPSNYAANAGSSGQYNKFATTYIGMSTDKRTKSPIEDGPDQATGTQLLQKNFSTTSISSASAPYSTARLTGFKTYGGFGANTATEDMGDTGKDKEIDKDVKPTDTFSEIVPEPRPIPNILPIKYTQPS